MIKKYISLLSLALLILFSQIAFSQDTNKDAFYRAIQKTGETHSFNGKITLTEEKAGYQIDYLNQGGQNSSMAIKYMKMDTKEQLDAFWIMVEGFSKMGTEIYDNLPPTKKGKKIIEGIEVKTTDFPKCTLKNDMYSVESPRSRSMRFQPSDTDLILVTGIGDQNPNAVTTTLIQQLNKEGLLGQVPLGERFDISINADGYLKTSTYFHSGDFDPNQFVLQGEIKNKDDNKPIEGAKIILASPHTTSISDSNGYYRLDVKFTEGSKPFKIDSDFDLEPIATELKIELSTEKILPAPGNTPLKVAVLALDGKPIKGRVSLEIKDNPLASFTTNTGRLDTKGVFNTSIKTNIPTDIPSLLKSPESLQVTIEATIFSEVYNKEYSKILTVPLNLAVITGLTTGPDMQPRKEKEPPSIDGIGNAMRISQSHDENGNFYVLVHPLHPLSGKKVEKWSLVWSDRNRLPLSLPLENLPESGAIIDVGKVDLLTPEEHIKRLKEVLIAFAHAMPLTVDEQSRIQKAIGRLGIQYGSTNAVPFFKDHYFDDSGTINIPGDKEIYWGSNLKPNHDDAAYEILPHEIGHFIHHHIVERYAFRNVCYNKMVTGEHETWKLNPNIFDFKRPYVSFSENTADFFAILFRNFWVKHSPKIKESLYFKRNGYLHEFESDEKAMDCIARGIPGYKQEGVQTRFLRVFYGAAVVDKSPDVMSDYLNTMLLYMDTKTYATSNLTNRPARTISKWAYTKLMIPTSLGHADVLALASRYRVNNLEPVATASPVYKEKEVAFFVDDKLVDFGHFQVSSALYDQRLKLTKGMVGIDLSDFKNLRNLIMKAPCEIRIKSKTEIEVYQGIVSVDFPADLITPGGKVTPKGTITWVEVSTSGTTQVKVLDGQVNILTNTGKNRTLKEGQASSFDKDGSLGAKNNCQPKELYDLMLPDVDFPIVATVDKVPEKENLQNTFLQLPKWAIIILVLVAVLIAIAFLYIVRRYIAALIIAPSVALSLLVLGRLALKPDYVDAFDFFTHLMSPWEAFQSYGDWLSAVSWLIASVLAGLMLKSGIKGFIGGLFFQLIPLLYLYFSTGMSMPNDLKSAINSIGVFFQNDPENIIVLLSITAIGGLIGGVLRPEKTAHTKRNNIPKS